MREASSDFCKQGGIFMALDKNIKKVLVIGSGPIIIGQAAEFDYAGTQACRALKEEGIFVVLVNSNPATIMTDEDTADRVYIEPLDVDTLEKIISKEKPDALLPTLGGQTGLNLSIKLSEAGILKKHGVKLIGADVDTIKKSEDRELFKTTMEEIAEPVTKSIIAHNVCDAVEFSNIVGFPLIIRPAFTLGGSGGGIANNIDELYEITQRGLDYSIAGQVLIEQSLLGFREIEYEVMRDKNDNCIIICNMENIDPVGVHTGDSIVVAPSQTLTDKEYQMLRSASIKIIRSLNIEGGCNVQFALSPWSMEYYVIEVNPRVSRSSALASKATGYPIARIAAKIAIGYTLDEIKNPITGTTSACFEPALDYIVVKVPRWPFDKFKSADRSLGTQMKATGEVMAIDRSFEGAFMKAIRSLEIGNIRLFDDVLSELIDAKLIDMLKKPNDMRLFAIGEALYRDFDTQFISNITSINIWFLEKFQNIINVGKKLIGCKVDKELLEEAKGIGFCDYEIGKLCKKSEQVIKKYIAQYGIAPVYKTVDTCAGEFESRTSYYYSCYDYEDEVEVSTKDSIVVLGSGSIRIGQGIEFDYCAVHSAKCIKKIGYESIIINNNPETVSTDYDTADKLYFEPLYIDDVLSIINKEKPKGVIVQFGGQTAINVAKKLSEYGVNILGTNFSSIDIAEDRKKFDKLLEKLNMKRPQGFSGVCEDEILEGVKALGFPVLVRPSYVIGGQSMKIVGSEAELLEYIKGVSISEDSPLLVDKYIEGMEVEVDAICDGENVLIPGIMEHIEKTGVHSGDSMAIFPSYSIGEDIKKRLVEMTTKLAIALNTKGLINIQYAISESEIYVIEANPRASRTVPIISKVSGIPMVDIATKIILGDNLKNLGYEESFVEVKDIYAVKAPSFSFEKLLDLDTILGPEMKSTGEVMGLDQNIDASLYKAFLGCGYDISESGNILVTVPIGQLKKWINTLSALESVGFTINIISNTVYEKDKELQEKLAKDIRNKKYKLIISTDIESFAVRRLAIENRIGIMSSIDTVEAYIRCISFKKQGRDISVKALQEYKKVYSE